MNFSNKQTSVIDLIYKYKKNMNSLKNELDINLYQDMN